MIQTHTDRGTWSKGRSDLSGMFCAALTSLAMECLKTRLKPWRTSQSWLLRHEGGHQHSLRCGITENRVKKNVEVHRDIRESGMYMVLIFFSNSKNQLPRFTSFPSRCRMLSSACQRSVTRTSMSASRMFTCRSPSACRIQSHGISNPGDPWACEHTCEENDSACECEGGDLVFGWSQQTKEITLPNFMSLATGISLSGIWT